MDFVIWMIVSVSVGMLVAWKCGFLHTTDIFDLARDRMLESDIDARLYALDPQLAIELGYEPPSTQKRGPVSGREIKGYASNAPIPDSAPTGAYVDHDWEADFYARSA